MKPPSSPSCTTYLLHPPTAAMERKINNLYSRPEFRVRGACVALLHTVILDLTVAASLLVSYLGVEACGRELLWEREAISYCIGLLIT